MNAPQENLPIWKRNLRSNGSSVPPAWAAFACDRKFEPRLSTFLTKSSNSHTFSFRIICGADVLVQGQVGDFLACIATARHNKVEWTKRLPFSDLRTQFFYPSGKFISFEEIKVGMAALDAPPPMDKAGCVTGPSVGEAVARRCAASVQISPARSEARTAVICAADGRGFAFAVDCAFSQAGVVAPPDGLTDGTFAINDSGAGSV
ncbi:hypothetical protein OX459_15805 [Janthinobacterium sp. SUN026]|uniref:hypothetical protein n=1 Tax=Janthinobacterium sp. SUN026 TaxID=3002438 RepID=UPI0025AFB930|nr:hypothetical protein [Janthinobacterium sp. SUN026]MDN2672868.1 hypothetical protein [Janthinobacterium sp. SUN026]